MEVPRRKNVRLKDYDYSRNGAYFITVCTRDRRCILSDIVGRGLTPTACGGPKGPPYNAEAVGRGLAPTACGGPKGPPYNAEAVGRGLVPTACGGPKGPPYSAEAVGWGLAPTACGGPKGPPYSAEVVGRRLDPAAEPASTVLTDCGLVVESELLSLTARYPTVKIEKYVIMPNHIHALLLFEGTAEAGAGTVGVSPRPTLMQVVGAFKSLSTRKWNQKTGRAGEKLWQASFHEHIIRDDNDFLNHWQYIDDNPARWAEDEYFGGPS